MTLRKNGVTRRPLAWILTLQMNAQVEAEMQAALDDYHIIGSDLSMIPSCGALAVDPSQLTRWVIGDEKLRVGTVQ
jgi:phosphatidylinositol 3,5-bisphosphate 5-phosphatase